ncbi:HTH domain-containing protein [Ligilactobacillus pobuzihii]|uniref:BglG family transcription antiterminator n=1 Tax=Ligilactobacillus pobuzihii TaxID=449659 RepID=UPI0019D0448A|nr:HTH domain-containing protein [Ligilactobacillus pobuzihii]MBN7274163.1 HTH domain-containing protein [Ligilactobacillus pobuzihii]
MDEQDFTLLNFFIKNDSVSLPELTGKFDVSKRTMLKRIHKLNEDLAQKAVIQNNGERFYIFVADFQYINSLQSSKLKESLDLNDPVKRQAEIMLELILNHDYVVLDDLSEKLNVSKGTLNADLRNLKHRLLSYPAQIVSSTNRGIKLTVASAYVYGVLLKNFVSEYCDIEADKFQQGTDFSKFYQAVEQAKTNQREKNELLRNAQLVNLLHKAGIRMTAEIPSYLQVLDLAKIAPLIKSCNQTLGAKLTITEIRFLFAHFTVYANSFLSQSKLQTAIAQVRKVYLAIIKKVKQEIDISLNFELVFEQIRYHLVFMINRSVFGIQTDDLLSEEVAEKYPVALDLAMLTTQHFEEALSLRIPQVENDYLSIYYQMALSEQEDLTVKNKVAIVGPVSNSVRHFIAKQMNDIFADQIEVVSYMSVSDFSQNQGSYLMVFSNMPLEVAGNRAPVVRINSIFRKEELKAKVQVFQIKEQIDSGNCNFKLEFLDSKLDYFTATEMMIQNEINNGRLNQSFLDSWREREERAANIFKNGIAIPHVVDNSNYRQILLKIGVFNEEITYKGQKVRLVFLIGIPRRLNQELNKVLTEVYDFIFTVSQNQSVYRNLLNFDQNDSFAQLTEGI